MNFVWATLTWESLSEVCVEELCVRRMVAVNLSLIDDVDYLTILDPFWRCAFFLSLFS